MGELKGGKGIFFNFQGAGNQPNRTLGGWHFALIACDRVFADFLFESFEE